MFGRNSHVHHVAALHIYVIEDHRQVSNRSRSFLILRCGCACSRGGWGALNRTRRRCEELGGIYREGSDGSFFAVVVDLEVVLGQTRDGVALTIAHHDAHVYQLGLHLHGGSSRYIVPTAHPHLLRPTALLSDEHRKKADQDRPKKPTGTHTELMLSPETIRRRAAADSQ